MGGTAKKWSSLWRELRWFNYSWEGMETHFVTFLEHKKIHPDCKKQSLKRKHPNNYFLSKIVINIVD